MTHRFASRRWLIAGVATSTFFASLTLANPAPTSRPLSSAGPAIAPVVPMQAVPLPLAAVRLTGGPLKHAQDLDAAYLLKLEPDRMLAALRKQAGLSPKAAQYGGWDAEGRQLTGHIAGHYLSAVSYMYQATGDERFKQRADYIVGELKEIQAAHGDGYIGGLMGNGPATQPATTTAASGDNRSEPPLVDGKTLFQQVAAGDIRSGGFDLNGMWSPWYVQHKLYAGLRDAYRLTGNRDALDVEIQFAAWAERIVGGLDDAQIQRMLATEFGAMNEVAVDLYADTGDARWLQLAERFHHKSIVDPLAHGQNVLPGKHGNTQVPKLLGHLVEHVYTGDQADGAAAKFFYDTVVAHHTFASGGHGYDEYFGPPDKLSGQVDGTGQRSKSLRTAETCNVYNMLKYGRLLFALDPQPRYAEFHERALFNHILASIHPQDGRTSYMVPVGPGVSQEYQEMFESFTCCVGTGMESHALHADGLYYTAGEDRLYVNQFAPSTARWDSAGVELMAETDFPLGDSATIRLKLDQPKSLTLMIRRPAWAVDGFAATVNDQPVADLGSPGAFVEVKRRWTDGDVVRLSLPKTLRTEPLPDNRGRVAILWGPLVLAGEMGTGETSPQARRAARFPVFAEAGKPLTEWLKPVADQPGRFRATLTSGQTVTLSPFYQVHDQRYSLYWDLLTPEQWAQRKTGFDAQQTREQAIADATVLYFQPGEMQPERDFNFRGDEESKVVREDNQPGRRGGKWIEMELWVDPKEANALMVTTQLAGEERPSFDVSVGGKKVDDDPMLIRNEADGLTEVVFRLPSEMTENRSRATFRLQARDDSTLPSIFGIRTVRADDAGLDAGQK